MSGTPRTRAEIIEQVKASDHNKVKLAVADLDGVLRGKYINKAKFLSAAESGFGFCTVVFGWDCADVCYDNVEFTGWHTGYPDVEAHIDLSTFRTVPWDDNVPFFLADFHDGKGKALAVCPRQLLKTVVQRANDAGYSPSMGFEFEFFNFRETPQSLHEKGFRNLEPLTPGMFGYSLLRASANQEYFAALMDEMYKFGVPLEALHTETGPGVLEAAILYSKAVEAADRAILFKAAAKEIGGGLGIMPTFMAKISPDLPGCSGHLHQSIWTMDGKQNLFYDEQDPLQMGETFKHYLAGQMHCLPHILPFFAPTVNSFKRLVEGMWAPTTVTWGADNRTTAFRVLSGGTKSTRLETRVPGADINPYLAGAAAIASGMYGVANKLELTEERITGNGYAAKDAVTLPRNLLEATEKMMRSEVAREMFGNEFIDHFGNSRLWECREFQKSVSDWELQRYFETV
jgi:glutamine synthetase